MVSRISVAVARKVRCELCQVKLAVGSLASHLESQHDCGNATLARRCYPWRPRATMPGTCQQRTSGCVPHHTARKGGRGQGAAMRTTFGLTLPTPTPRTRCELEGGAPLSAVSAACRPGQSALCGTSVGPVPEALGPAAAAAAAAGGGDGADGATHRKDTLRFVEVFKSSSKAASCRGKTSSDKSI